MSEGNRQKSGLTAAWVSRAKPKDKAYKLSDRDGLYLLVVPSGSRVWRINYRMHGKQRTITFGRWPELLLGEARERLIGARRLLANGVDLVEQAKLEKKKAKSLAAAHTFETVANEWIEKVEAEGAAAKTVKKARWLLSKLYPAIGRRAIGEISTHELLAALKKIEATKRYDTATRARSTASRVFRLAITTART